MAKYLRLGMTPAYLMLCVLLGGASAAGFWANLILQLMAIPMIVCSLVIVRQTPVSGAARHLLGIAAAIVIVILLQLIPLPPGLWTALPGRGPIAEGFVLAGQPLPWLPISLDAGRTVASALWLLPAYAVLLSIVRLGNFTPAGIAWTVALASALSVCLGALQIAGGNMSSWYIYRITNYGQTTGFFSNSNHLATLLLVSVPFITALYVSARARRSARRTSGMIVVLGGAIAISLFGLIMNTSLAGLGLGVPVALASLLMLRSSKTKPMKWGIPVLGLATVLAVGLVVVGPFGNNLTGKGAEERQDSRYTSFGKTITAAIEYAPLGSGIGTFADVYRTHEDPKAVTRVYMNHAHSDYLELALETGIPGIVVILVFLLWWLRRTIAIWSAEAPDAFARAATIASGAIVAHSIVDYPLRTAAIAALFAAACALMAEPRPWGGPRAKKAPRARHLSAD